jgi:bifunctional non-homologous end joining protein LigD
MAGALTRLRVKQAWLDGEAVVLDGRKISSFQLLQEALSNGRGAEIVYFAFDLLYLDGVDTRAAPLEERKAALKTLLSPRGERIHFLDAVAGHGPAVLARACTRGLEGIVSKRREEPYRAGRGHSWVKTKCVMRQEFVIGGFTDSDKSPDFGALLLGVHDVAGRRQYAGRVGTGFTAQSRKVLRSRLIALERKDAPFPSPPTGRDARGVHWVKPVLVAEVAFTNRTRDGRLRHPAFHGLREDKHPRQVVDDYPIRESHSRRRP